MFRKIMTFAIIITLILQIGVHGQTINTKNKIDLLKRDETNSKSTNKNNVKTNIKPKKRDTSCPNSVPFSNVKLTQMLKIVSWCSTSEVNPKIEEALLAISKTRRGQSLFKTINSNSNKNKPIYIKKGKNSVSFYPRLEGNNSKPFNNFTEVLVYLSGDETELVMEQEKCFIKSNPSSGVFHEMFHTTQILSISVKDMNRLMGINLHRFVNPIENTAVNETNKFHDEINFPRNIFHKTDSLNNDGFDTFKNCTKQNIKNLEKKKKKNYSNVKIGVGARYDQIQEHVETVESKLKGEKSVD